MISPRILPLAVLLSLAILTGSARAQTTQNDETAALRQKVFALLESVGGQIGTLQSAENRARLGANVADSLWTHDEKLARSILLQVEADIRTELEKWQPQTGKDATLDGSISVCWTVCLVRFRSCREFGRSIRSSRNSHDGPCKAGAGHSRRPTQALSDCLHWALRRTASVHAPR